MGFPLPVTINEGEEYHLYGFSIAMFEKTRGYTMEHPL